MYTWWDVPTHLHQQNRPVIPGSVHGQLLFVCVLILKVITTHLLDLAITAFIVFGLRLSTQMMNHDKTNHSWIDALAANNLVAWRISYNSRSCQPTQHTHFTSNFPECKYPQSYCIIVCSWFLSIVVGSLGKYPLSWYMSCWITFPGALPEPAVIMLWSMYYYWSTLY